MTPALDEPAGAATGGLAPRLDVAVVPEVVVVPDYPPSRHELSLIHSGSFVRAACADCGWRGPGRRAVRRARADGALHISG